MARVTLSAPDERGLRLLTLERPERANALSAAMVEQLLDHLDTVEAAPPRALAIAAQGRNFCGGFDFDGHADQSEGDLLLRFVRIEQMLQRIRHARCITIACVAGAAFGAGADLAAACTYRIGTAAVRFRFPGFRFGVALGTRHLARLLGQERARQILLHNQPLDATAAGALLTHRVGDEGFDPAIAGILADLAGLDAAAMAALLANTGEDGRDRDLAELVRSLSRPGLHARIARYRQASA